MKGQIKIDNPEILVTVDTLDTGWTIKQTNKQTNKQIWGTPMPEEGEP